MQNINIPGTFPKASTLPKEMHLANWGQRWLESSPVQTCSHMTSWHRVSSKLQLWYFYILSSKALVSMEPTLECHRFETLATQVPESTANLCYTSWHNLSFYALAKKTCLQRVEHYKMHHIAPCCTMLHPTRAVLMTWAAADAGHWRRFRFRSLTWRPWRKIRIPVSSVQNSSNPGSSDHWLLKMLPIFFKTPTNLVSPNSHY